MKLLTTSPMLIIMEQAKQSVVAQLASHPEQIVRLIVILMQLVGESLQVLPVAS